MGSKGQTRSGKYKRAIAFSGIGWIGELAPATLLSKEVKSIHIELEPTDRDIFTDYHLLNLKNLPAKKGY